MTGTHQFDIPLDRRLVALDVQGKARVEDVCLTALREEEERVREVRAKEEERRRNIESSLVALSALTATFREVMGGMRRELDEHVVRLALSAAKKVLNQEVEGREHRIARLVEGALAFMGDLAENAITVRVHPGDHQALTEDLAGADDLAIPADLKLIKDPAVTPGGCIVQTEGGKVITDWRSQLRVLEDALLGASDDES